jgi:hypothetical protein
VRITWVLVAAGCGRVGFDARMQAGDAPASDVASDVAGDGLAASTCPLLNVKLCDGFDDTTVNARWMVRENKGQITIDPTRAYRGTSSLHAHLNAALATDGNLYADVLSTQGMPFTGIAHVRAWSYFASPFPPQTYNQLLNFSTTGGQGIAVGTRDGFITSNDYTDSMQAVSATDAFPLDRWVCLELQIPSGLTGMTRVFVDGVEVSDVQLPKPSPQPAPDQIYIGLVWLNNTSVLPAIDAWFDEVVVDDAPTSCPQ